MKNSIIVFTAFIFLINTKAQIVTKEVVWEEVYQTSGGECFDINSDGNIFAGTDGSCVLRTTNGGDDWEQCQLPTYTGMINSIAINSNDHMFLTTASGFYDAAFYRSIDNGDTWVQIHADSGDYFTCLDINSTDVIFFGTNRGVVRSLDNGDNLEQTGWDYFNVEDLIISPIDDDIFILSGGSVFRSTDSGSSWTNASSGLTNLGINAFGFNSHDHIFAGTATYYGGVFVSTNNGENWALTGYANQNSVDSVVSALFVSSANHIFIGTLGLGVLCSTDDGDTWTEINSGIPSGSIIYSFIVNEYGKILVGTSMGIFRSLEPIVSVDNYTSNLPNSFILSQNFPNPFNPFTKIKYSVPQISQVQIKIYDVLGNEIETLVNEEKPAGTYEVTWNAANLPSGVYFYQLWAGDFVDTKKMILIK
jgi:photosystem II stability/assembly factor-like uncharacterized protein